MDDNERTFVNLFSHILIRDKDTKQILLNKNVTQIIIQPDINGVKKSEDE